MCESGSIHLPLFLFPWTLHTVMQGELLLPFGVHYIEIDLPFTPTHVTILPEEDGHVVCGGGLSAISDIKIVWRGFRFQVAVESNTMEIKWIAY
jgi:hypothetical protein